MFEGNAVVTKCESRGIVVGEGSVASCRVVGKQACVVSVCVRGGATLGSRAGWWMPSKPSASREWTGRLLLAASNLEHS